MAKGFISQFPSILLIIPLQLTSMTLFMRLVLPPLKFTILKIGTRNINEKHLKPMSSSCNTPSHSNVAAFLLHSALCLDAAIEYPLILAYHPSTLMQRRSLEDVFCTTLFRNFASTFASVCLLLMMECLLFAMVHFYKCLRVAIEASVDEGDSTATDIAITFVVPRASLLVCVALIASKAWETNMGLSGGMEIKSVVWWLGLRQIPWLWASADIY